MQAEQQQAVQPEQLEPVQDVKAEMKRLGKRYTGSDPTRGIRFRECCLRGWRLACILEVLMQWGHWLLLCRTYREAVVLPL